MLNDELETIVGEEKSKSTDYEACDAYWLLVVVAGMGIAQD